MKKEGILKGQGNPFSKNEILNLLKKENKICKITYEEIEDNKRNIGKGTGFFIKQIIFQ